MSSRAKCLRRIGAKLLEGDRHRRTGLQILGGGGGRQSARRARNARELLGGVLVLGG